MNISEILRRVGSEVLTASTIRAKSDSCCYHCRLRKLVENDVELRDNLSLSIFIFIVVYVEQHRERLELVRTQFHLLYADDIYLEIKSVSAYYLFI